jgi:hypothetical protein
MPTARRTAVLDAVEAILTTLAAAETAGKFFRSPEHELNIDSDVPCIVLYEGDDRLIEDGGDSGADWYELDIEVAVLVKASPLHQAYAALYGAVLAGVLADLTVTGTATHCKYTSSEALQVVFADGVQAVGGAALFFTIIFETAPNDPFNSP